MKTCHLSLFISTVKSRRDFYPESHAFVCNPMYSYITCILPYLVECSRMLLVFSRMYSSILVCYSYVTRMYSCGVLVMIRSQEVNRISFVNLPNPTNNQTLLTYASYVIINHRTQRKLLHNTSDKVSLGHSCP